MERRRYKGYEGGRGGDVRESRRLKGGEGGAGRDDI